WTLSTSRNSFFVPSVMTSTVWPKPWSPWAIIWVETSPPPLVSGGYWAERSKIFAIWVLYPICRYTHMMKILLAIGAILGIMGLFFVTAGQYDTQVVQGLEAPTIALPVEKEKPL